jgi:hypothetical protein
MSLNLCGVAGEKSGTSKSHAVRSKFLYTVLKTISFVVILSLCVRVCVCVYVKNLKGDSESGVCSEHGILHFPSELACQQYGTKFHLKYHHC